MNAKFVALLGVCASVTAILLIRFAPGSDDAAAASSSDHGGANVKSFCEYMRTAHADGSDGSDSACAANLASKCGAAGPNGEANKLSWNDDAEVPDLCGAWGLMNTGKTFTYEDMYQTAKDLRMDLSDADLKEAAGAAMAAGGWCSADAPACAAECFAACVDSSGCSCAKACIDNSECDADTKASMNKLHNARCGASSRRVLGAQPKAPAKDSTLRGLLDRNKNANVVPVKPQQAVPDRQLWWHSHNPHRHNPHRHNPHRHNPHHHATSEVSCGATNAACGFNGDCLPAGSLRDTFKNAMSKWQQWVQGGYTYRTAGGGSQGVNGFEGRKHAVWKENKLGDSCALSSHVVPGSGAVGWAGKQEFMIWEPCSAQTSINFALWVKQGGGDEDVKRGVALLSFGSAFFHGSGMNYMISPTQDAIPGRFDTVAMDLIFGHFVKMFDNGAAMYFKATGGTQYLYRFEQIPHDLTSMEYMINHMEINEWTNYMSHETGFLKFPSYMQSVGLYCMAMIHSGADYTFHYVVDGFGSLLNQALNDGLGVSIYRVDDDANGNTFMGLLTSFANALFYQEAVLGFIDDICDVLDSADGWLPRCARRSPTVGSASSCPKNAASVCPNTFTAHCDSYHWHSNWHTLARGVIAGVYEFTRQNCGNYANFFEPTFYYGVPTGGRWSNYGRWTG